MRERSGKPERIGARGQQLVIGGYIPGSTTFDSILVGYYEGSDLMYAGRIRNVLRVEQYSRIWRVCRSTNARFARSRTVAAGTDNSLSNLNGISARRILLEVWASDSIRDS